MVRSRLVEVVRMRIHIKWGRVHHLTGGEQFMFTSLAGDEITAYYTNCGINYGNSKYPLLSSIAKGKGGKRLCRRCAR